jgi:diacylglycerol kinase family enzyme
VSCVPKLTSRLLVISHAAGGMNEEVEAKLRRAFADYLTVDFDPARPLDDLLSKQARVVVAGGDGSVEFIVRKFAETRHPIGIIPLGTFNNLARALGLPTNLERAIAVARSGQPRPITLGRVNDRVFVEACAIGLFGETIALGESAKDMEFGKLAARLRDVIAARPFHYELSGDFEGSGSAMSLVFSNTATIGALLSVGDGDPLTPQLEFSVHAGRTRTDIAARALRSALPFAEGEDAGAQVFKFKRLDVKTRPRVRVYADSIAVGRTPATISAEVSALRVFLARK